MAEINKQDLDNWITGHWGEDQFKHDEPEEEPEEGLDEIQQQEE